MPSFVPHIVVPGLVALAFFPVAKKRILLLAPLVWLPDLDYIIPSQHRAVTHSVFIPIALFVAAVVLWRRRAPEEKFWSFVFRPGAACNLFLVSYFIASHLLMDVFAGGVVLFWPIADTNFFLGYEIVLDTKTNEFTPEGEAGTEEGAPELSPQYTWLSVVDTAVVAFLGAMLVAWSAFKLGRARKANVSDDETSPRGRKTSKSKPRVAAPRHKR